MIRRGEMLYRYAPELMSKVFDPARKIDKPGVAPRFAQAMDGPLGPITPPPPVGPSLSAFPVVFKLSFFSF
jgi:hypothetical protein